MGLGIFKVFEIRSNVHLSLKYRIKMLNVCNKLNFKLEIKEEIRSNVHLSLKYRIKMLNVYNKLNFNFKENTI